MNQIALENFKIDKSNWKKVKLGDVVFEPKETVKDPAKEGIQHVVGLEHIDSEDIHLRRSASIDESTTFTKKFIKDDVLFGRRRAYLKKAAVADFDGICSGDITVMRAKNGLLPALLPFIIHNDKFFDFAITHSAGGLSPRVKFKDLSRYEFHLPSKDKQFELIELLSQIDGLMQTENDLLKRHLKYKLTASKDLLLGKSTSGKRKKSAYGEIPHNWEIYPLAELRDINAPYSFTGGPFGSNLKSEHYTQNGVRVLQLQNIGVGEFLDDYKIYTSLEKADELFSCNIFPGEIILAKMDPVGRCTIIPAHESRYVMCSDGIRLKVDEFKFDSKFIYHAINTVHFLNYVKTKCTGTTRSRITLGELKKVPVIVPNNRDEQSRIAQKLDLIDQVKADIEEKCRNSKLLFKSFVNQLF